MWKRPSLTILAGSMLVLCLSIAVVLTASPVGVSPEGLASERCPTFSWSEAPGDEGYELVVYGVTESGEVGTDPLVSKVLPRGVQSWTPPGGSCLAAGERYAWLVRSLGPEETLWSEPTIFEVTDRPSVDEVEEAMRTLRRYLADREEGAADPRRTSSGPADGKGPVRKGPETRSEAASSSPSAQDSSRAAGRRFEALTSGTEGMTATTAASAPALGTPSLTVDSNIALGTSSNLFKDGNSFLWDDGTGNLALGRFALVSADGYATRNLAVGRRALYSTTEGASMFDSSYNTAVGFRALTANTYGYINTALGDSALRSNTEGFFNTAIGSLALADNTTGYRNTAVGVSALGSNTTGYYNTAIGYKALYSNVGGAYGAGSSNVAVGLSALESNTSGGENTAIGYKALHSNNTGGLNTAIGAVALYSNSDGVGNVAIGHRALLLSDESDNVAVGDSAMRNNTSGHSNTAVGDSALQHNITGEHNVAIGEDAGSNAPSDASGNIFILNTGSSTDTDSNGPTIRIGTGAHERAYIGGIAGTAVSGDPVHVTSSGQLGYSSSSRRFKEEIEPLDEVGDRLFELEPVTFRYRPELVAGGGDPEVGLIAEEVAEVFPELVTRDEEGEPHGVRYDLLSVLLLEELQDQRELNESQREALRALRQRLTSLEEGRPPPEEKRPWWRRIFSRDRDSP